MTKGENYESFMARFAHWPAYQRLMVQHAYLFAKGVHAWQKRRGGERYFEHLRGAAIILVDELIGPLNLGPEWAETVCATLLHDALEDAERVTAELLAHVFGGNDGGRIPWLVDLVTKQRGQSREQYWKRLFGSVSLNAWLVKAADRLHNLRDKPKESKIRETADWLLPMLDSIYVGAAAHGDVRQLALKRARDLLVKEIQGGTP